MITPQWTRFLHSHDIVIISKLAELQRWDSKKSSDEFTHSGSSIHSFTHSSSATDSQSGSR